MPRFDVYVVPRSKRPGPDGRHDGVPRLRVTSPPADGRANSEAERSLSELLGGRVRLTGGGRSRRKTFEIESLSTRAMEEILRQAFGD
jgi:uncharacterized protein YggU (UPF0235/DUF167 family)